MANYDIRFVLRHAQSFIRQSGWIHKTTFTQNDKAVIVAEFDVHSSRISCSGKLVKDLKILLAYPLFDFCFKILHDGSLFISIDKRLTPSNIPHHVTTDGPRQNNFTLSTLNHTRRKNNGTNADQPRNRTSHKPD